MNDGKSSGANEFVSISQARLDQVVRLLSFAAVGDFSPASMRLEPSREEDSFSIIESTLFTILGELVETRALNEQHIASLQKIKQELEDKVAMIESQRATIGELSTPIIEVWKDVLTLPVVGMVDSTRAAQMTDTLLLRIDATGARCVVIDFTGVDLVDTTTALHFLQMMRAARLLGTYCVVTGLRPAVAQSAIQLGIDLGDVVTLRTLKDGLLHCLKFLRNGP